MSLFLSRIALSPLSARAMRLAGSPKDVHALIIRLHDGPTAGRLLFRVDPGEQGFDILVQGPCEPDWSRLDLDDRDLRDLPGTKPFDFRVESGAELGFRLLARPTMRKSSGKGNPPGTRSDFRTDPERLDWLSRKAQASGFRVVSCGLTIGTYGAVHSTVPFRQKGGSFSAVRFDGELVVTDPEKLAMAVENGIGPQKAYGFGLLSLARLQ